MSENAAIDFHRLTEAVPLFKSFPADEVERLVSHCSLYRAEKGQTLFEQGERAPGVYIVVEGLVHLDGRVGRDDTITLAQLHKGAVLGESSLVPGLAADARAVAAQDALLLLLPLGELLRLEAEADPAVLHLIQAATAAAERRARALVARIKRIFAQADSYRGGFAVRMAAERARSPA